MTFQLWDGYGVKLDGAGLTMTLKATLDGVTVFDDLAMTAADESNGLYYATYNFQNPGDHDSQIKVTNAQSDTDFCDPVTLEVREPV
jgi:hypothetical protein